MKIKILLSVYILITVIISFQIAILVQNKKITELYSNKEESFIYDSENITTDDNSQPDDEIQPNDKIQSIEEPVIKNIDESLTPIFLEKINELEAGLNDSSEKIQELKNEILTFEKRLDELNETFLSILNEQKKQTIDVSAKDSAIEKMRTAAKKHFSEKEFSECAKVCKDILSYENNDLEIRSMKFKSLYYTNPADSSRFTELMNDFKILENHDAYDAECLKIMEIIKSEKGINND